MKKFLEHLLILLSGTFILMSVAFYNGYPLVYSDTGTYIYSGFEKFIPVDRPMTYGLFLWMTSLKISTWLVVFVQNFIVSFLLFELCQCLLRTTHLNLKFLLTVSLMTFFTGVGWYSNQLMPDIFAPVLFLAFFLLLVKKDWGKLKLFLISFLFVLAAIVHLSHLLILVLTISFAFLFYYFLGNKIGIKYQLIKTKQLVLILILALISWITLPTINYLAERKFVLSKGSHVFLMAHLADTGLLEKFLRENCDKKDYKDCRLCEFKDKIPTDLATFIWEENGVFAKTGKWDGSIIEYNKIITGMLLSPEYLVLNIWKSTQYCFVQLFKNEIGQGLSPYLEGSPPYGQINWQYHFEINNYKNSRQNIWNGTSLNIILLKDINLLLNIGCFLLIVILFTTSAYKKVTPLLLYFTLFSLMALVINSYCTAGLNAPCERFQARVVWFLPLALLLILYQHYADIILYLRKKFISKLGQDNEANQ